MEHEADVSRRSGVSQRIVPTDRVEEAWGRWLEGGIGIPEGLMASLRSAVISAGADGCVLVNPIAGPSMDRLTQRIVLDQISEGLTPYLGRRPDIVVEARASDGGLRRVSQEEVHQDTLKSLYRQEPRLERAVEELDLELME